MGRFSKLDKEMSDSGSRNVLLLLQNFFKIVEYSEEATYGSNTN